MAHAIQGGAYGDTDDDGIPPARIAEQKNCTLVPAKDVHLGAIAERNITKAKHFLDGDLASKNKEYAKFQDLWKAATEEFKKRDKGDSENVKVLKISILAYTMENPGRVYADLNEQCRTCIKQNKNLAEIPLKGWLFMLFQAETFLPSSPSNIKPLAKIACYRGVPGYHEEECVVGRQQFSFNQFGSVSTKLSVAIHFTKGNGTLYEIDRIPAVALGIQDYSYYHQEQEVLVYPSSLFRAISVVRTKDYPGYEGKNLTVVKLEVLQ